MANDSQTSLRYQSNNLNHGIQVYGSFARLPAEDATEKNAWKDFGIEYQATHKTGLDQFYIHLAQRRKWNFPVERYYQRYGIDASFEDQNKFSAEARVKFRMHKRASNPQEKNIFIDFFTSDTEKCETVIGLVATFEKNKQDTMLCEIYLNNRYPDRAERIIKSLLESNKPMVMKHAQVMKDLLDFCTATPKLMPEDL